MPCVEAVEQRNEDMDAGPQGSQVPSLSDGPGSLWVWTVWIHPLICSVSGTSVSQLVPDSG